MRRRFVSAITAVGLLAASLSCRDGTGPVPAARVEILAERTALVRATELQLGITVYDASDNALEGRTVAWESSNGSVLSVTDAGLVRAVAAGTARVSATVEGKADEVTLIVTNGYPVIASGILYPFTSGSAEPMRVSLRNVAGAPASMLAGADGAFSISGESATEAFDVLVQGENQLHRPALLRYQHFSPTGALRIVMTPARWTPPAGTYAATTVDVNPVGAFEPPPTATGENYDGFWPGAWLSGIKVFGAHLLPARLAFDRPGSDAPITEADSVAFWAIVRDMEADLGRPLFVPASIGELTLDQDGKSAGAVIVRIDDDLSTYQGYANWWWMGGGIVYAGVVRLGSSAAFAHSGLVTHELLHTLGFKHSCSWPTVMGGYGCTLQPRLSPQDVAHAQLAFAMRDTESSYGAANALAAALNAQLVLQYGMNPVPVGNLAPWSGARLLMTPMRMGKDGAY